MLMERKGQQSAVYQRGGPGEERIVLCRSLVLTAALAGALAGPPAFAQGAADPVLSAATAEKMVNACMAYAKARNGAVNIWIYDGTGGLLHFRRMDGAPPFGPALGGGPGGFGTGLSGGGFEDPTGFNAAAPGSVPVEVNGRTIATVRAAGMGAFSDRACARAAAEAAVPAGGGLPAAR